MTEVNFFTVSTEHIVSWVKSFLLCSVVDMLPTQILIYANPQSSLKIEVNLFELTYNNILVFE